MTWLCWRVPNTLDKFHALVVVNNPGIKILGIRKIARALHPGESVFRVLDHLLVGGGAGIDRAGLSLRTVSDLVLQALRR